MKVILFVAVLSLTRSFDAQTNEDTLKYSHSHHRMAWSAGSVGIVSIGSIYGLGKLWYSQENKSSFHIFNDSRNWLQMDKMGHSYTCYEITRGMDALFSWSGLNKKKSLWVSAGIGFGYLGTIEILDGFNKDWGFSFSDIAFNALGVGLYTFQEYYFSKQWFKPKFSFHPTEFARMRPEVLGENFVETLLKDYNGQTYWLSFSPGNMGVQKWPKWLMLSAGHSINGRLKGDSEIYQGIQSHREFLFSLDIDLTEIQVKSKLLKGILEALNTLKFPFPALIYSNGKLNARPIYF